MGHRDTLEEIIFEEAQEAPSSVKRKPPSFWNFRDDDLQEVSENDCDLENPLNNPLVAEALGSEPHPAGQRRISRSARGTKATTKGKAKAKASPKTKAKAKAKAMAETSPEKKVP